MRKNTFESWELSNEELLGFRFSSQQVGKLQESNPMVKYQDFFWKTLFKGTIWAEEENTVIKIGWSRILNFRVWHSLSCRFYKEVMPSLFIIFFTMISLPSLGTQQIQVCWPRNICVTSCTSMVIVTQKEEMGSLCPVTIEICPSVMMYNFFSH